MGSDPIRDGSPVDVLPTVEPDDELDLYFDRYNQGYSETPQSPVRSDVTGVETKELTEEDDLLPGTLITVSLTVPPDDEKADRYWLEHRTEHAEDETMRSVSDLLYEDTLFSAMPTTGQVGHIDRIVVNPDDRDE